MRPLMKMYGGTWVRKLGKGLLIFAGASLLVPFLMIVILGVDDDLSPSAQRYHAIWPAPLPPVDQNGFYALAGLLRPEGEDPHKVGQQWYAKLASEKAEDEAALIAWQQQEIKNGNAMSWSCGRAQQAKHICLETILAKRAEIESALRENALIAARFDTLLAFPAMTEPYASPSFTAPMLRYPVFAIQLSQARSVLAFADGRYDEALRTLEARWRLALKLEAGAATLVTKMVGIARLREEQALLSQMLAQGHAGFNTHAARIAALLGEYDMHPHGFARVWHGECRMHSITLANIDNPDWRGVNATETGSLTWIEKMVSRARHLMSYRAHRSMNDSAEWCDEMTRISSLPPAQALDAFAAWQKDEYGFRWLSWQTLRNPAGHLLVRVATPDYGNYVARSTDLQGSNRLVRLQAAVVSGEPLAAVIARRELSDPYTNQPMHYDQTRQVVSFTQRQRPYTGEAQAMRIEVPVTP